MRLFGLLIGAWVFAFPTAVVAQTVSPASLIGTWVKVLADSEKIYRDPSTGSEKWKKDYPGGNVDGKILVDHILILTLRSDSTFDLFWMVDEKKVIGINKGERWHLEGAKILPGKKEKPGPAWDVTAQGKELSIAAIGGVFKKYADTTAPYGVFQRRTDSPKP